MGRSSIGGDPPHAPLCCPPSLQVPATAAGLAMASTWGQIYVICCMVLVFSGGQSARDCPFFPRVNVHGNPIVRECGRLHHRRNMRRWRPWTARPYAGRTCLSPSRAKWHAHWRRRRMGLRSQTCWMGMRGEETPMGRVRVAGRYGRDASRGCPRASIRKQHRRPPLSGVGRSCRAALETVVQLSPTRLAGTTPLAVLSAYPYWSHAQCPSTSGSHPRAAALPRPPNPNLCPAVTRTFVGHHASTARRGGAGPVGVPRKATMEGADAPGMGRPLPSQPHDALWRSAAPFPTRPPLSRGEVAASAAAGGATGVGPRHRAVSLRWELGSDAA